MNGPAGRLAKLLAGVVALYALAIFFADRIFKAIAEAPPW